MTFRGIIFDVYTDLRGEDSRGVLVIQGLGACPVYGRVPLRVGHEHELECEAAVVEP